MTRAVYHPKRHGVYRRRWRNNPPRRHPRRIPTVTPPPPGGFQVAWLKATFIAEYGR